MPSRKHPRRRQPARRRDLPGSRADRQPAHPRRARAAARPRQGSGILLGWGLHPVVPDRKSRRIHPGQRGIPLRPQHLRPAAEMDQHRDADGPLLARFRPRRRLHRQPDLHRPGDRRADRIAGSSPRCSTWPRLHRDRRVDAGRRTGPGARSGSRRRRPDLRRGRPGQPQDLRDQRLPRRPPLRPRQTGDSAESDDPAGHEPDRQQRDPARPRQPGRVTVLHRLPLRVPARCRHEMDQRPA